VLHVALWEPEIPPNTGNIARLCAATGVPLHLIGRLGFRLDERSLRRAGLDYWPEVNVFRHARLEDFNSDLAAGKCGAFSGRTFCLSAKATVPYTRASFTAGDALLFGNEGHGLPSGVIEGFGACALTIPMLTGKVRSLNLATAVGIVLYEALRQLHSW